MNWTDTGRTRQVTLYEHAQPRPYATTPKVLAVVGDVSKFHTDWESRKFTCSAPRLQIADADAAHDVSESGTLPMGSLSATRLSPSPRSDLTPLPAADWYLSDQSPPPTTPVRLHRSTEMFEIQPIGESAESADPFDSSYQGGLSEEGHRHIRNITISPALQYIYFWE